MTNYSNLFKGYRKRIDVRLEEYLKSETRRSFYLKSRNPYSLFDPLNYIMSGGGKRIRPLVLMLSCEAFGGNFNSALDAAVAIEILHNFTLVHDDIMDNADTRRGQVTIHKKWSVSTAILVGDELIGLSYRSLLRTESPRINEIVKVFTDGVIEVCEGQALDNQFETREDVYLDEYMVMIQKKTAELLKASAVIGSIIANANHKDIKTIIDYSLNLGMAFQIQDDLLDVVANENKLGKKIGGDILEKKKTFLYLKSLEISTKSLRNRLLKLYHNEDEKGKIDKIINIYNEVGVLEHARNEIEKYTVLANDFLTNLSNDKARSVFQCFSDMLLNRGY